MNKLAYHLSLFTIAHFRTIPYGHPGLPIPVIVIKLFSKALPWKALAKSNQQL